MEIQIHTNLCLHMCTYRHIRECMQAYAHIYSMICILKVVPLNGHLRKPCIPPKPSKTQFWSVDLEESHFKYFHNYLIFPGRNFFFWKQNCSKQVGSETIKQRH